MKTPNERRDPTLYPRRLHVRNDVRAEPAHIKQWIKLLLAQRAVDALAKLVSLAVIGGLAFAAYYSTKH